jgi:hypothetical protein
MTTINESIELLRNLYLGQIANGIKLRIILTNGSSREGVETLKAEARRIEADIYPIARNLCEFADIARLGAYLTFIEKAGEREAGMAKADYSNVLRQMQAKRPHRRRH